MSLMWKYITGLIFAALISAIPAPVFGQQDNAGQTPGLKEETDTTDYLPLSYESALNYNLMIAAMKGYSSEIVRIIGLGGEVNAGTDAGMTPLAYAVMYNHPEAVLTLLNNNATVDQVTATSETPLIIAVKSNFFDICEALLRGGADIDLPDRNGATPLHYAAINGYMEITDLLLYYGASIDEKSDDGATPLLASVMAGHADIADLLLQNSARTEEANHDGFTPFLTAAANGDTLIMDLLLKHGAGMYAVNMSGYSALDLAISSNHPAAARYLLKNGRDWHDAAKGAVNPYLVAEKYRRKEMAALLKEYRVPGEIRFRIDQATVTLSGRFVSRDYYSGLGIAFKEPYINAGLMAGIDMKLWYTRVLVKNSEQLYHQYYDKDYMIYAGAFKDFALYEIPYKSSISLSGAVACGYSFGHTLRGTYYAPGNKFLFIPSLAIKWNIRKFGTSIGAEYVKTEFEKNGPVWIRAGLTYTMFLDNVRSEVKSINWY